MQRSRVVLVSALVVGVLAVPGAGAAVQEREPASPLGDSRLPEGVPGGVHRADGFTVTVREGMVEGRPPASARPAQAALDAVEPSDARTWLDGVRAFVAAAWGLDVGLDVAAPAQAPRSAMSTGDDEDYDGPWPGTAGIARPGGDLDGDGLEDTLVTIVEDGRWRLEGRRSTDGELLWSADLADIDDAFPIPAGDLTGDGRDDLLVWALRLDDDDYTQECGPGAPGLLSDCRSVHDQHFTWRVGLRSGGDGSLVWAQDVPGTLRYEEWYRRTGPSYEHGWEFDSTNLWVLPLLSEDHDGDGLADLLLNDVDVGDGYVEEGSSVVVAGDHAWSHNLRSATRARVARGADGETLVARTAEEAPAIALLLPAGGDALRWDVTHVDDTGTSCSYLLFEETCEESDARIALTLELVDARTLEPRWRLERTVLWDGFSYPVGDLTGDGVTELVLLTRSAGGYLTEVVGSTDGRVLWERAGADSWVFPVGVGDVDGDGWDDVVTIQFHSEEADGLAEIGFTAERLDGRSGEVLFTTAQALAAEMSPDGWWGSAWVSVHGDGDGDGVTDVTGDLAVGDWEGGHRSRILVESGATGAPLYLRDDPAPGGVFFAGDLDGDGTDELIEYDVELPDDGILFVDRAIRLADEAVLWTLETAFWSDGGFQVWLNAGDQTGSGADDLLLTVVERGEDGRFTLTAAGAEGHSAADRWRVTWP